MSGVPQLALLGLDIQELTDLAESSGEPAYRGRQLFQAIYGDRIESPTEISTLPQSFRQLLNERGYAVGQPEIQKRFVSSDGTVRYLMAFDDGESVETVWMPEGDSGEAGDGSEAGDEEEKARERQRATICVSSQVGCAVGCEFCLTALLGVKRNLTAGEIVGQIITALNDQKAFPGRERLNLVFMGMGEPLLNFDNFMKAVRLLAEGVGIPQSRMTVSTAGIVPRIYDLGREAIRPKLAISLNASNDELRSQLMPLNRKWSLEMLLRAAREFPLRNRERLTFEYVLLDGVNDSLENAREVLELIRGLRAKVNLIALNPGPGIDFATPAQERVLAFQQVLMGGGVPTFIRRPRGRDIYAACGQLKRST
ncbi:MAG TPA: 23S rRNA (adenine(2503)-C(2))-methyltransferase RlmN [Terriglobales bacterium]|jgi:23S rRNA (adenine2503-C2)-methyltransferase|nr:23S rRNA (adenine(2503)-C(2))-methyltransferase RlmN [Terriglobales bacterium]